MLGDVLNDVEQDATFGTLPAIPFESFFMKEGEACEHPIPNNQRNCPNQKLCSR